MIKDRIKELFALKYEDKLLISDFERLSFLYLGILYENEFQIFYYDDIEQFRMKYESQIRGKKVKVAIILRREMYIPYDIINDFYQISCSLEWLYPKLNSEVLRENMRDLPLIDRAYEALLESLTSVKETKEFIIKEVFNKSNVKDYCSKELACWKARMDKKLSYKEWIEFAEKKALLEYYAVQVGINLYFKEMEEVFLNYVITDYKKLSGEPATEFPVILPKITEFITPGKVALIVMDGMSEFDFEIISRYFKDIEYEQFGSFALIPTVTAISRQSLLAGKYPQELDNPFSLSKEKQGFIKNGIELGYQEKQLQYVRGYEFDVEPMTKFISVIINDIDDLVHGQLQGRIGMYNDIKVLAESLKLQKLIKRLQQFGFTVFITADHGNTPCVGTGSLKSFGVETETRSKRMLVLKEFATQFEQLEDRMFTYPGYYLDKKYQYFICKNGISLDNKDEAVMTHGGISIEEVIVPFIKIKVVQ